MKITKTNSKKYLFLIIGLLCMFLNVYLELGVLTEDFIKNHKSISYLISAISKISSSIGLALIIGYFTAKIKISEKLGENITKEQKAKIIKELVVDDSKLNDYKIKQIDSIFNLESRFRSNTTYTVNIHLGKDKNQNEVVVAETHAEYVEYNANGFKKINTYFDSENSYVDCIKISDPENINKSFEYKNSQIHKTKSKAFSNDLEFQNYCNVNPKLRKLNSIRVESKYVFFGQDHWISYGLIFQCPTQGVSISITLQDGLSIKECSFFDDTNSYSKTQDDAQHLLITSNHWLTNHSGFLLVVSK